MQFEESIARACEPVPGLVRAALGLLPEGVLIAGVGAESSFDQEPLIRSATHCLAARNWPATAARVSADLIEYVFVLADQLIVVQGGRQDPRLVLVVVCTREANIAFVLGSTRRALRALEDTVNLRDLGV